MSDGLTIPPAGGLDFVSVGALVNRLDPGLVPWRKASKLRDSRQRRRVQRGRQPSGLFPHEHGRRHGHGGLPIGDMIHERVRAMGVIPFYKHFKHNGVNGPNMATVYSDRGQGVRAPVVFYNRSNEAGAQLKPGDFDWAAIFKNGIRWFHSGGIFAALSETTGEVIIEGMKAAKQAGAVCSFDLNFREKLWNLWGGQSQGRRGHRTHRGQCRRAGWQRRRLAEGAWASRARTSRKSSKLDARRLLRHDRPGDGQVPQVKIVATTLREVSSTNRHTLGRGGLGDRQDLFSPTCDLDVLDRVGGGDGFASGFFYGLLSGESPEAALGSAGPTARLLTTTPGDTTMVTLEQVQAFAKGGSARIQR
jgi:2-dehydro-3-deoxygluconokinase